MCAGVEVVGPVRNDKNPYKILNAIYSIVNQWTDSVSEIIRSSRWVSNRQVVRFN